MTVWMSINTSQKDLITGVAERIVELRQITVGLQKTVALPPLGQVEVTKAGTSVYVPPKEMAPRAFQLTDTGDQVMVEIPLGVVQWKPVSQKPSVQIEKRVKALKDTP